MPVKNYVKVNRTTNEIVGLHRVQSSADRPEPVDPDHDFIDVSDVHRDLVERKLEKMMQRGGRLKRIAGSLVEEDPGPRIVLDCRDAIVEQGTSTQLRVRLVGAATATMRIQNREIALDDQNPLIINIEYPA